MTIFRLTFLLLISLYEFSVAQSQKTIKIKMTYTDGYKPFPRSHPITGWTKDVSSFKIKSNVKDFIVKEIPFCLEHSKYEDYKKGLISYQELINLLNTYSIDTSRIYKGILNSKLYCLVGLTNDNKRSVIFDQNGDFDFSNDNEYIFEFPDKSFPPNSNGFYKNSDIVKLTDTLHSVKVKAACRYDTFMLEKELSIKPIPYNSSISYPTAKEQEFHLQYWFNEHLEGCFQINKHIYHLALSNFGFPILSYRNKNFWQIMLRKDNEEFPIPKRGETIYGYNDTIYIENEKYLIASVSNFGEEVTLKYSGIKEKEFGNKKGQYIPDFSTNDINLRLINTKILANKFLFVDFWGTWCGPCIKLLPKIKELHSGANLSKVEFISIASENDSNLERFNNFLLTHQINWPQVLETPEAKDKLSVKFNIFTYPTFLFIDKTRKILFKGSSEAELDEIISFIKKNQLDSSEETAR